MKKESRKKKKKSSRQSMIRSSGYTGHQHIKHQPRFIDNGNISVVRAV